MKEGDQKFVAELEKKGTYNNQKSSDVFYSTLSKTLFIGQKIHGNDIIDELKKAGFEIYIYKQGMFYYVFISYKKDN